MSDNPYEPPEQREPPPQGRLGKRMKGALIGVGFWTVVAALKAAREYRKISSNTFGLIVCVVIVGTGIWLVATLQYRFRK